MIKPHLTPCAQRQSAAVYGFVLRHSNMLFLVSSALPPTPTLRLIMQPSFQTTVAIAGLNVVQFCLYVHTENVQNVQ